MKYPILYIVSFAFGGVGAWSVVWPVLLGRPGGLRLFIRFIFKEYMVNKGSDSVFHLRNIRDEGMYWIFGYVRETIVQLDNTP